MNSFESIISLLQPIKDSLKALGFTKPTEIQAKIIPTLIENYQQDVHAQAQTGTGKTLAFGIPLLQAIDTSKKTVQALVMAPTRELVLQIYENLRDVSRGTHIIIEPIYGGMPITKQISDIKRGIHIIVGTPGRINDHLRRGSLQLNNLKILVLDEADIMLEMGFKEEIDEIFEATPKQKNIWLFSATVMAGITKLIKSHMHNVLTVRTSATQISKPQITQYYCVIPERQRIDATARFIEAAPDFNGIIFCRTKVLSTEITEELASRGFKVNCLHGDMKQSLRNHVIKGFKNRDFNILVATDVAARGIDISDLSHVINYSMPDDNESYVHRIGRTGRAGKEGIAILLISPSQIYRIKRLEKLMQTHLLEIAIPSVEAIINVKMGAVSDFIEQAKKDDKKYAAVDNAIAKIVDSFTPEQIRLAFEIALREKFFQGVHETGKKGSMGDHAPAGSVPQEICLELGTEDDIAEDQVRSYLYTTCTLLPQEVTKVRVLKFKTFISVPESRLKNCLELMRSNPIIKGKGRAYLVKDEFRPSRSSEGKSQFSKRPSNDNRRFNRSSKRRN